MVMVNRIWSVGADEPLQAVVDGSDCPKILRRTLTDYLPWQTRNLLTVRRALGSPRIAPQWVAALMAGGATVVLEGDSALEVPLADWEPRAGRIVTLNLPLEGVRLGEAHVGRTPADEPIVAACAGLEMENGLVTAARLFLTGVSPEPLWRATATERLQGRLPDEGVIREVAAAVAQEVTPEGDFRGSAEYRRALAEVLTRRALEACLKQQEEEE